MSKVAWLPAIVFAAVVAILLGAGLSGLGGTVSSLIAVVAFVGVLFHLGTKRSAWLATGTGLYLTAGTLVLYPVILYVPMFMTAGDGAEGAGTMIGSILGLVIWGFVGLIIGLVLFAAGYFVNKRGHEALHRRGENGQAQQPVES